MVMIMFGMEILHVLYEAINNPVNTAGCYVVKHPCYYELNGLIVRHPDGIYQISFGCSYLHDIGQEAVERMLEHPNEAAELVRIERGEAWTRTESLAVFVWETFFQAIARSVAETAPAVKARL